MLVSIIHVFFSGTSLLHHVLGVSAANSTEDNVVESNVIGHVVM